jgi:hypothetical protein
MNEYNEHHYSVNYGTYTLSSKTNLEKVSGGSGLERAVLNCRLLRQVGCALNWRLQAADGQVRGEIGGVGANYYQGEYVPRAGYEPARAGLRRYVGAWVGADKVIQILILC